MERLKDIVSSAWERREPEEEKEEGKGGVAGEEIQHGGVDQMEAGRASPEIPLQSLAPDPAHQHGPGRRRRRKGLFTAAADHPPAKQPPFSQARPPTDVSFQVRPPTDVSSQARPPTDVSSQACPPTDAFSQARPPTERRKTLQSQPRLTKGAARAKFARQRQRSPLTTSILTHLSVQDNRVSYVGAAEISPSGRRRTLLASQRSRESSSLVVVEEVRRAAGVFVFVFPTGMGEGVCPTSASCAKNVISYCLWSGFSEAGVWGRLGFFDYLLIIWPHPFP